MPPGDEDFQPTSGSIRLGAIGTEWFVELRSAILAGPAGRLLAEHLGTSAECLVEQCWARRQFPPALRPAGQHPHAWHQDGALGSRFAAGSALLPIITLWVALDACGAEAPSLEWIDAPSPGLLHPDQLTDASLAGRFGLASRRHALLDAGDALIFDGALVHRTFVLPAMRRPRVSIELRFVDTPPSGLA